MTCAKYQPDIALYAGGDLPAKRIAAVETHLNECAECRELADEMRANTAALSELRDEALEDLMVVQVRQRVLAGLQGGAGNPARSRLLAGFQALALAAALILLAIAFWPSRVVHHTPKSAPVARLQPAPVPIALPSAPIVPVRRRTVRRRSHRQAPPPEPGPPLLVQFVTDDPNIVVYWLVDQKPEGD